MRILLCDDEPVYMEQIQDYLSEFFKKNKLQEPEYAAFDSAEALMEDTGTGDIAFLDVEMPGISGIHVGEYLKNKNPNILIFIVTAYSDYLDEAMRFHVFRYLSKPVDKMRLFRNMKDALYQYNTSVKKVAVETKDGVCSIFMTDIVCVETRDRKVFLHTIKGEFVSVRNMDYWLEQLDRGCFFRTHRSFIVNMKYVKEFDKTLVRFENSDLIAYLTRRKYKQFKDAYLLYMESVR